MLLILSRYTLVWKIDHHLIKQWNLVLMVLWWDHITHSSWWVLRTNTALFEALIRHLPIMTMHHKKENYGLNVFGNRTFFFLCKMQLDNMTINPFHIMNALKIITFMYLNWKMKLPWQSNMEYLLCIVCIAYSNSNKYSIIKLDLFS